MFNSKGRVVITGIGKSAIIGQKMAATFNSTGTPSFFMHAADAIHGDLGMVQPDDIVICISKSGNSPEIKALIPLIQRQNNTIIGIVGNETSFLAIESDYTLNTYVEKEACPNDLAPTTSTTAQMAMGDALAVALLSCRDFKKEDFARYHPGGNLGKQLYLKLDSLAAKNAQPEVSLSTPIMDCILEISSKRLGAAVVVDNKRIVGIITDGDIRRMLPKHANIGNLVASDIMTKNPKVLASNLLATEGVSFVKEHKINHIILHENNEYRGVVHVQDLITEGLL